MKPFEFFEVVKIEADYKEFADVNGREGGVIGRGQHEDGSWGY